MLGESYLPRELGCSGPKLLFTKQKKNLNVIKSKADCIVQCLYAELLHMLNRCILADKCSWKNLFHSLKIGSQFNFLFSFHEHPYMT